MDREKGKKENEKRHLALSVFKNGIRGVGKCVLGVIAIAVCSWGVLGTVTTRMGTEEDLRHLGVLIAEDDVEMAMAIKYLEFIEANDVDVALQFCKTNAFKFKGNPFNYLEYTDSHDIEEYRRRVERKLEGRIINNAAHAQSSYCALLFGSPIKLTVLLRFADYREKRGELTHYEDESEMPVRGNEARDKVEARIKNGINNILLLGRKHKEELEASGNPVPHVDDLFGETLLRLSEAQSAYQEAKDNVDKE